jgi:hypothetical protein
MLWDKINKFPATQSQYSWEQSKIVNKLIERKVFIRIVRFFENIWRFLRFLRIFRFYGIFENVNGISGFLRNIRIFCRSLSQYLLLEKQLMFFLLFVDWFQNAQYSKPHNYHFRKLIYSDWDFHAIVSNKNLCIYIVYRLFAVDCLCNKNTC